MFKGIKISGINDILKYIYEAHSMGLLKKNINEAIIEKCFPEDYILAKYNTKGSFMSRLIRNAYRDRLKDGSEIAIIGLVYLMELYDKYEKIYS